jgi:formamidopyrimidine-DNA glycosylase
MYHAKLHPEQYSDTFNAAQLKQLHTSILYVCQTAVDTLAESEKFPEDWLFKHRWGKGKKDKVMQMPNGAKITFLTVGGRTSCVVPSVQKKTGAVASDLDEKDAKSNGKGAKKKTAPVVEKSEEDEEGDEEDEVEEVKPTPKKRKADPAPRSNETKKAKVNGAAKAEQEIKAKEEVNRTGRRRSARVSKG